MKYHLYIISISVLLFSCKAGKKIKTTESVSSIAAQSDVILASYKLNEMQSINHNSITSGLLYYPIDPQLESYLKIGKDSSITTKNAALNLTKEDKKEVINTFTKSQDEQTKATELTRETNINRHTAEKNTTQVNDFRKLIVSLIMLVIAVIGYILIRKIR